MPRPAPTAAELDTMHSQCPHCLEDTGRPVYFAPATPLEDLRHSWQCHACKHRWQGEAWAPENENASAPMTIRLTPSDFRRFTAKAQEEGLTLSGWLRWIANRACKD